MLRDEATEPVDALADVGTLELRDELSEPLGELTAAALEFAMTPEVELEARAVRAASEDPPVSPVVRFCSVPEPCFCKKSPVL